MSIDEIKKFMKDNKITYEELADKAGLSISTVKKIFSGSAKYPRIDTMQAIEKALGIDQEQKAQVALNNPLNGLSPEDRKKAEEFIEFLKQKSK